MSAVAWILLAAAVAALLAAALLAFAVWLTRP